MAVRNPDKPALRDRRHSDGGTRKPRDASPVRRRRAATKGGTFAREALRLFDAGLLPVPAAAENIKKPGVAHGRWSKAPGRDAIERWAVAARYRTSELGILPDRGRFPVTVVDIDDPGQVEPLVALLGPTPLVVATPSGGRHLYYRFSGEHCANLRRFGWSADIKATGGYVVAPPSRRQRSPERKAGRYRLVGGSWANLPRLPALPTDWQERVRGGSSASVARRSETAAQPNPSPRTGKHRHGLRNTETFSAAMRFASISDSLDDLLRTMHHWNASNCEPPLDEREVTNTTRSAWRYQVEGRNFLGIGGISLSRDELHDLGDADAAFLWLHLQFAHAARDEAFALVIPRMVEEASIPGLGVHRLRQAVGQLIRRGYLRCVYQGGRRKGDPSLYRLAYPRRNAAI